jgi:hypothetical protein
MRRVFKGPLLFIIQLFFAIFIPQAVSMKQSKVVFYNHTVIIALFLVGLDNILERFKGKIYGGCFRIESQFEIGADFLLHFNLFNC